jgi:hypothetical protein
MLHYTTRKKLKCSALLVPTLLRSFINIGTVLGDTTETKYYFTPTTTPSIGEKILDVYADQSVYLIDLTRFEFTPTSIQIKMNDALVQEEELAKEEHQLIYEIDLKRKPEGIYKITISDNVGNEITERITHKTS